MILWLRWADGRGDVPARQRGACRAADDSDRLCRRVVTRAVCRTRAPDETRGVDRCCVCVRLTDGFECWLERSVVCQSSDGLVTVQPFGCGGAVGATEEFELSVTVHAGVGEGVVTVHGLLSPVVAKAAPGAATTGIIANPRKIPTFRTELRILDFPPVEDCAITLASFRTSVFVCIHDGFSRESRNVVGPPGGIENPKLSNTGNLDCLAFGDIPLQLCTYVNADRAVNP